MKLSSMLFGLVLLRITAISLAAEPFDPADVRLLDSPFKAAADRNTDYLLSLEPDRFLHYFRTEAGLAANAPAYPGWESANEGAGRCLGHYLSALAQQYRSTGDLRLKQKIDYLVDQLAEVQAANGDGYLGAEADGKIFWADLRSGNADALKKHRVPWYVQHKMFAGLRDACLLAGNPKAKQLLMRLGGWAIAETARLDDRGMQKMLEQEHGGMVEVAADLYGLTKDPKYLDLARRFVHHKVIDPLAAGRDELAGLHANTQIPKVIGAARLFELTGEAADRRTAEFFWTRVVDHHSYANGGNSDGERFGPPDQMQNALGIDTSETCNTYNMLKLTDHLFRWDPQVKYADYTERALFNHILASSGPEPGNFTYYVSMKPGHYRVFSKPFDSFWCCVGTGMENQAKYNNCIYYHDADRVWVNQYIPSKLTWKDRGVVIEQTTDYPASGSIRLAVGCEAPTRFSLNLRYPAWAPAGATLAVNGVPVAPSAGPGSFVSIDREWKNRDRVQFVIPVALRTEPLAGDPHRVAIFFGPVLLAGQLDAVAPTQQLLGDSPRTGGPDPAVEDLPVGAKPVDRWVRHVHGKPLEFEFTGTGMPAIPLVPFYAAAGRRYTVYWKTANADEELRHDSPGK
jgi:DUF1680 family protein